jgi:hypothetical protein
MGAKLDIIKDLAMKKIINFCTCFSLKNLTLTLQNVSTVKP